MKQRDIGLAIDSLAESVKEHVRSLTSQYRASGIVEVLKQAVDTPHRAQAQLAAWIADYNARNGAGSATTFLASCLTAAGSAKTLTQVNADLAALAAQAQTLVTNVQTHGWSWDQVATAIEQQMAPAVAEAFDYAKLPIPDGYTTVWGEPWA